MSNKMGKPIPCPFCGMELHLEDEESENDGRIVYWSHEDAFPNCIVALLHLETKEDVDLWNKRAEKNK